MKNSIEPLSIMFKNIDGVTSNFDLFSTEITSTNDKLSVAETNLDECNKNLFNINGYQSVYQSKIKQTKQNDKQNKMIIICSTQYKILLYFKNSLN